MIAQDGLGDTVGPACVDPSTPVTAMGRLDGQTRRIEQSSNYVLIQTLRTILMIYVADLSIISSV